MDASTTTPEYIDPAAEETCPAPPIQVSQADEALRQTPAVQPTQAPSPATFELMNKLEALARDVAEQGHASSDRCVENVPEGPDLSSEPRPIEPSITVSPRPAGFESDQFPRKGLSLGRRTVLVLASIVLIGVGATFAWQSPHVRVTKSDNGIAQPAPASAGQALAPATSVPHSETVTQAAAAPAASATSPEVAKQLDAMVQDLIYVRRGIEDLVAKQEQLAAAQQKLEQLAETQQQLAAKQEKMAQNIAKLQALEQATKQKASPPAQSRAASIPPRVTPEPATQPPPAPRPALHPVPPLPVPP